MTSHKDYLSDVTGWSKTGNLTAGVGGTDGILNEGTATVFQTLQANFVSNKERMGAGSYTIQFGINPPANNAVFARADITWSIAGGNVLRTVDIVNGKTVTGVGEAVKIRMYDNTPEGGPAQGQVYGVFCQVTKGTRPSQNQPPTVQANVLTTGILSPGSADFDIPLSAGVISVEVCGYDSVAKTEANLLVTMFDSSGGTTKIYVSPGASRFVPVAPSTSTINVENLGPNGVAVQVTYGIDG
jgi:hypothetical protein